MMFFKKKRDDTQKSEEWREHFQTVEDQISENGKQIRQLTQEVSHWKQALSKHDMAIEDLLEEWEEKSSGEDQAKERVQELQADEGKLLHLFEVYLDQFFDMKRFVQKRDEDWIRQMELMDTQIEHDRRLCGIVLIHACEERVDYDLHEVIETVPTKEPAMDQRVACVYRCGYLYKGQVRRKAQVSAYRLSE